ncbi:PSD1 and planctomycete cytochrome C domain-containing protein [Muriicola sp. Z0-33]|uniref:PSD1 and planctomycete cytochrome C domain-containing protein n=1 Tax=Muriicola sp. Z0-33 TaxID=2816957 RepID=UPI002238B7BB|nr:PSD1 and planctomycete cytochrome C domain-containing protein [Muriicola sp. Z0-33]MCW5518010.1 PSD1 domain-containing protein [Muriicola sp. Z0-33]
MKQKAVLITVLLLLTAIIYAVTAGFFSSDIGEYSDRPLPDVVDYNFDIKPILSDNCYTCHGPDANKRKAGLRLDIEEMAFAELKENPGKHALVAGKPGQSILYKRITSDDPKMLMPPPEANLALTQYEKKLIKKWIAQGGKYEKHWAFIPPGKIAPPKSKTTDWIQSEIDAFVLQKLEENNIAPSEKAAKETLIRRIALDLTGLPPKPGQTEQFISDNSENAIPDLIDEFLASPSYGERMTQMWLDVARYADSHGYQDDSYRTMWPWRDWVIHAFNNNMPYDRFLTWQLAGDLLPNANMEQILATGFNRNHPITQEGGIIHEEYLSYYVVDRTNTLGKGILGITLECAKCHDHKYDPISQKEYYGVYAFFNNVNEKGIQMDAVQAARQKYFADSPYITITDSEVEGVLSFINNEEGEGVNVMVMNDSTPRQTYLLNRGNYDEPTDSVETTTPASIFPFSPELPKNRLGLAKWVTDKNNPLTARVFVNRIWAMLFGNGLVETSEDFGVQGSLPSHPALLDWLSRDFMEHNWDIKYLIKKIMLSATYQQSSKLRPELKNVDPNNRLLARAQRFRMSGEMIRDYFLATSGLLNEEIGGASVKPYQPPGLWEETNAGSNRGVLTTYVEDKGEDLYRRSLYTFWKRTLPPPSMSIFDAPTRDFCEVRRQKTNTPLQALALQNDIQMLEAARYLAQQTVANHSDDETLVANIFQKILARPPKDQEISVINKYFEEALASYADKTEEAEKLMAVGASEVLETEPVKTAALMLTAQVIYNLDETITKE